MNLFCLDDRGGWGRELEKEAKTRGWNVRLFTAADYSFVDNGIVFMRMAQEADRLAIEKPIMSELSKRNTILIPDIKSGLMYEDKYQQSLAYNKWMPTTCVIDDRNTAENLMGKLSYPFLSKSRTGSASRNVRMIYNADEARQEIDAAFGTGLSAPHKMGELTQRGYLIWQKFLPDNKYDYRVVATGGQIMVLQRWNRKDVPFASGSGINNPADWSPEVEEVVKFSRSFLDEEKILWTGLDLVCDKEAESWRILETTLGWSAAAYANCQYYGTPYFGKDIWKVLCNEIEKGVFNV
jgi:hypothetical protein